MTELDFEKRSKSLHPTLHTLLIFTSTQSETAYVIRVREMKLCIATLYKQEINLDVVAEYTNETLCFHH